MPPKAAVTSQSRTASTSKSPRKRKSINQSDVPVYPFEKWSVAKLQTELKKYGFKTSRSRDTLLDRLKAVYQALEASKAQQLDGPAADVDTQQPDAATDTITSSTQKKNKTPRKGKGRKSDPFVLPSSSSSRSNSQTPSPQAGDLTLQLEREALSETDSSSSEDIPLAQQSTTSDQDEGAAVETTAYFSNAMAKAVKGDAQLWLRILRFEPISFDEFVSVAVQAGLDMGSGRRKLELRSWLDQQCVCHYTNDLTGPRARH